MTLVLGYPCRTVSSVHENDMKEKHSNGIEIVDLEPPAMSDILCYLYTGTAPNMKDNADNLLKAADKYEMPHLSMMCEAMIQSTPMLWTH